MRGGGDSSSSQKVQEATEGFRGFEIDFEGHQQSHQSEKRPGGQGRQKRVEETLQTDGGRERGVAEATGSQKDQESAVVKVEKSSCSPQGPNEDDCLFKNVGLVQIIIGLLFSF